tara:strand:+ start:840 stop:1193 length:354 start_codon:yes stop_codon:yes gene_type:complete
MYTSFKSKFSFNQRRFESNNILTKYPDRVPIILEKSQGSYMRTIDKHKYLVPFDTTIGQFMYIIRKKLSLKSDTAIFLFINGIIPPSNQTVIELYERYKDHDGFLYIDYSGENTFGN